MIALHIRDEEQSTKRIALRTIISRCKNQLWVVLKDIAFLSRFLFFALEPEVLPLPDPVAIGVFRLHHSRVNTHLPIVQINDDSC